MNFFKKLKLSFLSVVFIILLPITILIASGMAVINYSQSYNNILDELNKKLLTISSVTASFIDGDDHIIIAKPKQMKAFAYDNRRNKLYAIGKDNSLYFINEVAGAAIKVENINLQEYEINDITVNSSNSVLYAVTSSKKLLSVNLDEGNPNVNLVQSLDFEVQGIAYDSNNELIYVSSNKSLYKIQDYKTVFLQKFDHNLSALNFEKGNLYGVNRNEESLFSINLKNKKYETLEIENFPVEGNNLYSLAVNEKNFYAGNKHLMIYDRKEKTTSHEDFARLYRDETSERYQKYIKPMTEIKVALNLTYHYTLNLLYGDEENNTVYIFDVNEGNEYTPIGSYDFMDHEDLMGAEDVMLRDKSYIGDVKLWEKWGLLKVAYAGIKDKEGKVVAVAGTDIDITIIKEKTHKALIYSITIGLIALVLTVLASYYIAIKIIKPIEKLKTSALKIAAGKYDEKVIIQSPSELSTLSDEFNYMSEQLTNKLKNFKTYSIEVKERKLSQVLCKKLEGLSQDKKLNIKFDTSNTDNNAKAIIMIGEVYYIFCSEENFNSDIEKSQQIAIMSDVLIRTVKFNESLYTFMEIFSLQSFVTVDIVKKTVNDYCAKKESSFTDFKEIKINNISICSGEEK